MDHRMIRIFLSLLLAGSAGLLSGANDSKIVTTDGREIKTSKIEADRNGDLEYLSPDGKIKLRIPRGRYRYAMIPKPAQVTAADQKFREQQWKSAASLYQTAAQDYKLLGWDVYCIRMEAQCLVRSGEKQQAGELLLKLHQERENNPELASERAMADDLLADLLIDGKKYDEAEKILNRQQRREEPELAFAAYFKKAVIRQGRGDKRGAAMQFYQTALLFPNHPRRAEALFCAWSLLKELKSPQAAPVGEMLKREYPDSPYARQVFF
ncbi:MAG: hypothetical protein J5806_13235 [Lentisphaeria bacterium]|nr:hypothetical protein [Lentisphaeria bacterium]